MIRGAAPEDASRIAEILIFAKRTAYRPIFQNDAVSFNEMRVLDLALSYRDREGMLDDVYLYDDGIVRGMMSWDRSNKICWQLKELYVDPFFQGQGVGGALMRGFLTSAGQNGVRSVYLWVLERNHAARGFYESFGFEADGGTEPQPGTAEMLLRYRKELA